MAAAWEDMTDIQRASALELMGGKRQANTLSALIQNFDTVEKVIETSANSAGSALEENERYLDSIQGKIDQFNNAMQAMWSNTLDSDVVKGFVSLGTEIIKIIDKIGLLNSAFITLATISMIKNKMGPIAFLGGISDMIREIPGKIINFAKSFAAIPTAATASAKAIQGLTVASFQQSLASAGVAESNQAALLSQMGLTEANAAHVIGQQTLNASTLAAAVNNGTLTATQAAQLASVYGLTGATAGLNAAQMSQALTTAGVSREQRVAIIQSLGLGAATKQLTADEVINTLTTAGMSKADAAAIAAKFGLTVANTGLAASFIALWAAMWPVLVVMAGIAAIVGIVKLFDAMTTTTDELAEETNKLADEYNKIQDELESLNSELETTQERMAELLAMDTLTIAEEEELQLLRQRNAELEREIALKEKLAEASRGALANSGSKLVKKVWSDDGEFDTNKDGEVVDEGGDKGGTPADKLIDQEFASLNAAIASGSKELEELAVTNINTILGRQMEYIKDNSLTYDMDPVIDEYLDTIYGYSDKLNQALGRATISDSISRLFDATQSDSILDLKESLQEVANNSTLDKTQKQTEATKILNNALNSSSDGYDRLRNSMERFGYTSDIIARYFVQSGETFDSNTVEGITAQYQKGVGILEQYKNASSSIIAEYEEIDGTVEKITWSDLFDDNGNVIETQISKAMQGADNAARERFAKLAQDVHDGVITVEQAMDSFSATGIVKGFQLVESQIAEINTDVFKDLGDELSGVIDTFSEFGAALESVADSIELVSQAEAEMAYSGHVSVETALDLMQSTDNWNELLTVENGNIQLVSNATEILAQNKLDLIKKNLQAALATVEAQLAEITATQTSADFATTIEESTNLAVTQLAGNMAYLTKMMEGYARTAAGETVNMTSLMAEAESAKATVLAQTDYKKNAAEAIGTEGLEEKKAELEAMLSMFESVDTVGEFGSNYSSDEVSGGNATKEDARDNLIEDGWEKLLAEYENKLALITNERDLIQAEIDKAEAQGGKASAKYYEDLIDNSNAEKALLEQKKAALEEYLATNAGAIDQDTWTDYNNEINETAVAIKECEINTIEWAEAMREIDLHYFEQASDEISRLGDELEFVNGLLEDEEVADENGNWSSAALTRMGMYTNQMEMAAANAARYQEQIDDINEEYSNGAISEEQYQERLSDLVGSQQDAIMSYEDAKDSIVELNEARVDAIREGIEKEIEAYEDLIDAKKEELDAERDLHDFREDVKNQTKDIASLERRIAALSGSSAASDIAERRKLEEQLQQAKEGLNNTYYDHSRDAQSAALDEEAEAYTLSKERYIEQLEEQLKDTETLIQNSIMDVMLNADAVYTELNELADLYGIDLSDSLTLPWKNASAQAIKWKDELKASMTSGEYAALIGEGGAVTAFANGVATKLKGSWTTAQNAAKNYAGYLTGAELKNRFTSTLTGFGNQIQSIIDKWNGVKSAADAAYAAQTRKVTVGGTGSGDTGGSGSSGGSSAGGGGAVTKPTEPTVKLRGLMKTSRDMILGPKSFVDENTETINGIKYYRDSKTGYYYKISDLNPNRTTDGGRSKKWAIPKGTWFYTKHAKGTTGTTRDEWAITDEPQFGDELVLVPGKDGNLSFMRKGTGVVPADMTQKLFELAQIPTSDLMNKNMTAIVPNITKNDFKNEFNFESLVHVDTVDSDTLPKLEKMVDKKIDDFSRALNYSLKKFSR